MQHNSASALTPAEITIQDSAADVIMGVEITMVPYSIILYTNDILIVNSIAETIAYFLFLKNFIIKPFIEFNIFLE